MKSIIDAVVITCMFVALYVNLTSLPERNREVRGTLIKLEKKNVETY